MNAIVIATTTLYPPGENNQDRVALSKKTFKNAKDLGYKIVNVDGGSPEDLIADYRQLGVDVYTIEKAGMGSGRRQAIKIATEMSDDIVVWMEPEKEGLVSQIKKLADQLHQTEADFIIPKRKSLSSYPIVQQEAEKLGNQFWKDLTGTDLDMWFAPRVWKKAMSKYFLEYNGDYGDLWDSIFIPVMDAIFDKRKILSFEVDYVYPKEQTERENGDLTFQVKRFEQLYKLTVALQKHWNKLHQ